jgi:phosphate starvation-inducible membrane PsiE
MGVESYCATYLTDGHMPLTFFVRYLMELVPLVRLILIQRSFSVPIIWNTTTDTDTSH